MSEAHSQSIRIALAGNPNSGKTTIFNNLTGSKQHVGNYPGVTVEKKEGECTFNGQDFLIIDLPGTYSLTARSLDELVARNTIINEAPDVIVNVLDASNLERHLYLAAQLLELEKPLVMALNMTDVADEMGLKINIKELSRLTGAHIVGTIGRTNRGTDNLLQAVCEVAAERPKPSVRVDYGDVLEPKIEELVRIIEACGFITYPIRWVAIKLLENDSDVVEKVKAMEGTQQVMVAATRIRQELADQVDLDIVFQEYRHRFAVGVYNESLVSAPQLQETKSDKIDKILTNRWLGLPIFMLVMWMLFNLVFTVGDYPKTWIEDGVATLGEWINLTMPDGNLKSLLVDGVIGGVGAVLSFLPLIVILFLGISFLEDTGYMARAAFVMDRIMRSFGLHGKSFIPLLLGFGCTVPAIMGARILDNPKDRMVTILVSPFMSCSARLPVYTLLIAGFFPAEWGGSLLFGIYALGVVLAIIMAKIFRKLLFAGETEPFVMEMPPYHMPTLKSILIHMWDRAFLYIKKAGTFILAASILVWFLVSYPQDVTYSQDFESAKAQVTATYDSHEEDIFNSLQINAETDKNNATALVEDIKGVAEEHKDELEDVELDPLKAPDVFSSLQAENKKDFAAAWQLYMNDKEKEDALSELDKLQKSEKISQSYAAQFGKAIEPVIAPLGFNWRIGVGVVAAMAAKEVLISTLGTIYSVEAAEDDNASLQEYLQKDEAFSPLVALSLMVFVLIYPPCLASLAVIKRETNSWGWLGFMFLYGNVLAWGASFVTYQGGKLLGF